MDNDYCKPVCQSFETTFCPVCSRADRTKLGRVRLMGPIGVAHSNSPKIEEFWATGDATVFDTKK
jgi:hypothetical protein